MRPIITAEKLNEAKRSRPRQRARTDYQKVYYRPTSFG